MLARDVNAQPVQYRTWIVNDTPDYTGQFYTGDKSGPNAFTDVSAYAIFNPDQVCDFNLPNALDWGPTYKTLPDNICDAQLAVINGYIYLFGGQNSSKIYRASVNNPADFQDTGGEIPIPLAGSQLAIIGDYIWLFGGATDATMESGTGAIMTAPVSNPLAWSTLEATLPLSLHHSQLAIFNDTIYLFGGNVKNHAVSNILSAPVFSPGSWADTGFKLPTSLYGSQLAIVDGYVYLFGGLTSLDTPINLILSATLSDPSSWNISGLLPNSAYYGQFCTIGAQGYLFTSTVDDTSYTKILRCNLSNPSSWVDTQSTVGGTATQSHLAIVYDRIWLYGGNGSTIILANKPLLKYNLDDLAVFDYGNVTRTQVQEAPTKLDLFQVLGFAPWKTDYGS